MILHSYHLVRDLVIAVLSLLLIIILAAAYPKTLPYLADRFLKVEGLSYSKIEGTLLQGVIIHDLKYHDALSIKKAQISHRFISLLRPTPRIDLVSAEQVIIRPDKFPSSETNSEDEALILPPFAITSLSVDALKIDMDEDIWLDLDATDITVNKSPEVKSLHAKLRSTYVKLTMNGELKDETIHADTLLTPTPKLLDLTDPIIQGIPKVLPVKLKATLEDVTASTSIPKLVLTEDANLSMREITLQMDYLIDDDYLTFAGDYLLGYDALAAQIHQEGLFTLEGAYTSTMKATMTQSDIPLPFKSLDIEAAGDVESIVARADAGPLVFSALSEDYTNYALKSSSKGLSLDFIPALPDYFQKNTVRYESNATLCVSPFTLKGDVVTEGNISNASGDFDISDDHILYKATLYPKTLPPQLKELPVELFSPMHVVFFDSSSDELLNIDTDLFDMTLFKEGEDLSGWGNLATTTFSTKGKVDVDGDTDLRFSSSTPSVYELVSTFKDMGLGKYEFYDAQVDINTTLRISDEVTLTSRLDIPWYVAKTDSQTFYTGNDLFVEMSLEKERVRIDRYSLDVLDHTIYTNKPSYVYMDEEGKISLRSLWVYDSLRLWGTFDPKTQYGQFKLFGKRFHYQGPEGDVTAKVDITAKIDGDRTQDIEGKIEILEGVITAAPHNDYTILDDDIIIIQDVKPPSQTRRFINIAISAQKPVTYQHENIKVVLVPDFTLYQEPKSALQLLGMVHIDDGEIKAGDKYFYLQSSDIYLQGRNPINPYLDVHLRYTTLDRIDIDIFIANTLNSPVIVFTSSPPMSQDDILSYILFGGPATSTFESSGEPTTSASVGAMLLGTGLKTIFSDTTGVQVDTLNILTDKDGKLGYEVGARFSRDIRLVYKNDTISSIILQYSLNKWIRIDVDVRETGQGVNFLYIKDF